MAGLISRETFIDSSGVFLSSSFKKIQQKFFLIRVFAVELSKMSKLTFLIIFAHLGLINGQNVRYERTRYMTGRDRIHSNYPQNNIPVLNHLDSSIHVPKTYSSRPLFSWDDPRANRIATPRYYNHVSPTATTVYRYPKKYQPPRQTPSIAYRSSYVYNSNPYNYTREVYPQKVHQEHYGSKGYIHRNYNPTKNKSASWYYNRGYRKRKYCQIGSDGICRRIYPNHYGYYTTKAPIRRYRHSGEEIPNESNELTEMNEVLFDDLCEGKEEKCQHICKEENGEAICVCFPGYTLVGSKCADINECEIDNGGCDGTCINIIGSRKCICKEGFRFSSTDDKCVDVNECLLRNGHGPCQDKCTNTWGSYLCSCENLPGTKLAKDNVTCEEVDDCSIGCSHSCVKIMGRAFCTCPDGFELGEDWKTCKDIDECVNSGETTTQCEFGCINTIGSFYCDFENEKSDPTE